MKNPVKTKPWFVRYKGGLYLMYSTNKSGRAQLVDRNGKKLPGTPAVSSVEKVKELDTKEFNGYEYCYTGAGVFSTTTGRKVSNPDILKLFGAA